MHLAGVSAWAALSLAGCFGGIDEDKPLPPDISDVVADYSDPSLELTDESAQRIVDATNERITLAIEICNWASVRGVEQRCPVLEPFFRMVNVLAESDFFPRINAVKPEPISIEGLTLQGEGFFRMRQICPGWVGVPTDASNGEITAVVGFTDKGYDGNIFGTFDDCRIGVAGTGVTVSGEITAQIVRLESLLQLIVVLQLDIVFPEGVVLHRAYDVSVLIGPDGMALRIVSNGQNVVLAVTQESALLIAANGTWRCEKETFECVNETTGEIIVLPF